MDEKELELLLGKVSDQTKAAIKTELADALKGYLKADELAVKLEATGLKADAITTLTKAVEEQGLKLTELLTKGKDDEVKTLSQILNERKSDLEKLSRGDLQNVKIQIPVKTIVTTASPASNTIGMRLQDIGQMPYLGMQISPLFRHVSVPPEMNKTIRYIDQTTVTRNAAGRSETTGTGTGTFAESAIAWTEYSFTIPEIADSIPLSKESVKFISFVQGEINRLLEINLALKEDDYYWDGTGTPPVSKGVYTYAAAFDYAAYAAAAGNWLPEKANLYDLAMILQEQISNGYQSKYAPNLVIVNPGDMIALRGTKDANGNYLQHPLLAGNSLNGMEIVQSSQVTKNTMLVCDRRYATAYDAENVTIEMGYVGNQFVEGAFTMRAYKSTGILVRTADTGAFLKCASISAALAAINAVVA